MKRAAEKLIVGNPRTRSRGVLAVVGSFSRQQKSLAIIATAIAIQMSACGYAGTPPGTKPGIVVVTVSPDSATVALGGSQQFDAIVTGTKDTAVSWEVNSVTGGSAAAGTISTTGLYSAPAAIPSSKVTVTVVSVADATASASAVVNFQSAINVTLAPASTTVPVSGTQLFTAAISGEGNSSAQLAWSVNGLSGGTASTGTIAPNGPLSAVYTAPAAVPAVNPVSVTVASVADPGKSVSASVTISCPASDSINPSAVSVALGQAQVFSASLCIPPGASIAWDVNGILGGNAVIGTITPATATSATYSAPEVLPSPATVTVHATAANGNASAAVTLMSNVSVALSPPNATIAPSQTLAITPTVTGSSDANVVWTVNGIANGNTAVGEICATNSNPCTPPVSAIPGGVVYLAPSTAPSQNPVSVQATSQADPSRSATSLVTISAATQTGSISAMPLYSFLAATGGAPSTEQFFALDANGATVPVSWSVTSAVPGAGCVGSACGSIGADGVFTAPAQAPSPNAISIVATTLSNPAQTAAATVSITSGVTIETILPSSVTAGTVESFPLELQGLNFVAGTGASASAILLNGTALTTTCPSASSCAIALTPAELSSPGTLTLQIRNPDGALSNPVPFVISPLTVSPAILSLPTTQPASAPIVLAVTEPTTAASSSPMNVNFIGYLTDGDNCGIGAAPLVAMRPSSGSTTIQICIQGYGLDPSFTYSFGGPSDAPGGTDIPLTASAVPGLLPNMIELNLEISSSTQAGLRTLTITTLNGDRASATGMLEIQ
jgi:hypothetical protein